MLKYVLTLCVLTIVIPIVWAASTYGEIKLNSVTSGSHLLVKFYPQEHQVEFLKNLAVSDSTLDFHGNLPLFITPLGVGKIGFALVSINSYETFKTLLSKQHIQIRLVEVTTVNSAMVDNSIDLPSELPFPCAGNDSTENRLRWEPPDGYVIESPRVTNAGVWGYWRQCVPGSFVVGMELKTMPKGDTYDNSALNGIRLFCAPLLSSRDDEHLKEIQSLEGDFGTWGRKFICPFQSNVKGFQLRSEDEQGNDDDSGANNLKLICDDRHETVLEGDGLTWGDWSPFKLCLKDQAVCGIRTQVVPRDGAVDQSGVNNVDMICCSKSPP